ncbi:type II secretion system secretin GspD [Parvularcula dongshanensis]|uniref:General secretion pathway protein D n=1 Tax=Parvularcula dongshanensis TaxID=1173995 RepID=A0A840HZU7_9PROT|nr:type II secretion system secretin GspD [Parvularcula dongshanensis]MBB4657625.1 general secretion pathway protein D [Parvularcula dongshanensis]
MTTTRLRGIAATLLLGTALLAAAPAAAQQGAALNYEDADLRAVANDISIRTGRTFIIDPTLAGTVNIISPADADLTPDEVWEVFLATLQLNGFTAVPIGDREYKIVRSQQALREGGTGGQAVGADTVTRLVPLRNVDVREAANAVRALVADTGLATPITETNTLIVADTAANVERVVRLIEEMDVDNSVVRPVSLQNAPASEVAATLTQIINEQAANGRRPGSVSVVPNDATNQIILRGNPQEVRKYVPIIQELDTAGASRVGLDAIYLRHADAEKVVELLRGVLGDQLTGGEGGGAPGVGFGPQTSLAFDEATNAVVVNAPPDTQRLVRSIVAQLDIRRPQVLIEAIVVEISNTTARELGVQYLSGGEGFPVTAAAFPGSGPSLVSAAGAAYFLGPGSDSISGGRTVTTENGTVIEDTGSQNPALQSVAGSLVEAAVGQLLNFSGFIGGFADRTDDGSVYGVLLNAIQSDSRSNILNTPSVIVMDNMPARLQVGQEIPITTGRASGDDFNGGVFSSIERQDIGSILEVTPQINEGNTVQLEINLELSSISAFAGPNQDIITNKSVVTTTAAAESGSTLVIGGLIGNNRSNNESKVPILGDIPLLGNLFKGQTREQTDRTLMIFIRPTIIRDPLTADAVTARKYDYAAQEQNRADRRRRDSTSRIEMLESDILGTGGYVVPAPPRGGAEGGFPVEGEPAPELE